MSSSSRVRDLQRRAKKKDLIVSKSRIDGTFMVMLETSIPLFPERIKAKLWGKGRKIHPPMEEIYEAATLRAAEQFVKEYIPPWSRECDPDVAASIGKALLAVADACRNSRKEKADNVVVGQERVREQTQAPKQSGSVGQDRHDARKPGAGEFDRPRSKRSTEGRAGRDVHVCPNCQSTEIVPIIYGYPADMDRSLKEAKEGKMALGGCVVTGNDPGSLCRSCGHRW